MKIITFDYTDTKGKVSTRDLLVTGEPTDKYSGLDLGELPVDELADFRKEIEEAKDAYIAELEEIKAKYDMKHSFRQFLADNMSNITQVE